jgi:YD repeat-containing protein
MTNSLTARFYVKTSSAFIMAVGLVIVFCWCAVLAVGQTTKTTDGATPIALQAGAPSGSYGLGGFDNVSLYSGGLGASLPLLSIGGRGGAGHTIRLPFERHFIIEKYVDPWGGIWTYPVDGRPEEIKTGYGPGVMAIRNSGGGGIGGPIACPTPTPEEGVTYEIDESWPHYWGGSLTRLSFTGPDGTEMELRDIQTGGQVHSNWNYNCNSDPRYNRGKVFVSVDGSAATFISDWDIYDQVIVQDIPESYSIGGYLMFRDGTRYRIENGLVTWIRDRNGNKVNFTYDDDSRVTSITDSLNRVVTIVYDYNEGGSYGLCDKITYKGFDGTYGTTRVIRISKMTLSNVLRSGFSLTLVGYLFPGVGGTTYDYYNRTVASSVWLPDADGVTRRYQFQYNNYGELARVVLPTGGAYEYDYGRGTTNGTTEGVVDLYSYYNYHIYRRVVERREYPDGSSGSSFANKMTYSVPETENSVCCGITTVGYVTVEQRDGSNNLLAKSKHYFTGPGAGVSLSHSIHALAVWDEGKEYQSDTYDTNGTTVLRSTTHTWTTVRRSPRIPASTSMAALTRRSAPWNRAAPIWSQNRPMPTTSTTTRPTFTNMITVRAQPGRWCATRSRVI